MAGSTGILVPTALHELCAYLDVSGLHGIATAPECWRDV